MRKTFIVLSILFALFLACEEVLFEPDISELNVEMLAPLNGQTVDTNIVAFNWNQVQYATRYRFQIAEPDFEEARQLWADTTFVVDTLGNVNTQLRIDLPNGAYEWRIKAQNSGFETAYTKAAFSVLYIKDSVPALGFEKAIPPILPIDQPFTKWKKTNFKWTHSGFSGESIDNDLTTNPYFISQSPKKDNYGIYSNSDKSASITMP